eukprot:3117368-Rhodomonas_salina.3
MTGSGQCEGQVCSHGLAAEVTGLSESFGSPLAGASVSVPLALPRRVSIMPSSVLVGGSST